MSVTLQPSQPRISPTEQQRTQGTAPTQGSAQAPVSPPSIPQPELSTDGYEEASRLQQEWAAKFSANPGSVLQQTTDTNCGPAAALMASSKGGAKGVAAAQRMMDLESKFTDGSGTTPKQLSQMLAHEGVSVKQAAFKFDQFTVDETLKSGGKLLAMVDSNQITPGGDPQAAGGAHWVVIDGKDAQGRYTVKDPATGSSYGVDFNELSSAVDNGWWQHNGGGMLLVEDAPAGTSAAALAEENANKTVPLADTAGGGSNAGKSFGRESY